MKAFFKFFEGEVERIMDVEYYIDCRGPPQRLLRELKSQGQLKQLIKILETPTVNAFKLIRFYGVANLLLLYSKDFFQFVEDHLRYRLSKDEWINNKFLEPYFKFIIKCCASKDMYNNCKALSLKKGEALQMLFYSINMLKILFTVVQKMPFLGRYYKEKNNQVVSSAVEIIALQAQKLYGAFKHFLSEILYQKEFYIKNRQDQKIMRGILVDELIHINQEMKKLFLDKYFYPLGKGIGVKLFRPEQQAPDCEKTINSIVSNHEETQRQQRQEQLENTLFPGSGLVNWNFYEQTLMSGPLLNITGGTKEEPLYKDLDDLAISQEDDQQYQKEKPSSKKQQKPASDKETNTGTIQIKGSQM